LLRRFGHKVYFGDPTRLELLRNAGLDKAKLIVIAIDDADKILDIVRLIKKEFPHLKVFARARNRRHAYELYKVGVDYFRRETFDSSLIMAEEAMKSLGYSAIDMHRKAKQFIRHDEKTLKTSFAFFEQEPEVIQFAKQSRLELERILQSDVQDEGVVSQNNNH
jgi:glutathione-regulated potassium-efflux system ancillary protein KefC